LKDGELQVEQMGRGFEWLDTGTHNSLLDAGNFVRTLTERQGLQGGSPDEIAYYQGWIDKEQLTETANKFGKSLYGSYLHAIVAH
jgi:glucose-1-phosphate thymidylyltransferase